MTDSRITLILGGARSGKSTFGERLAKESGLPVTYIATANAKDAEMERRIEIHKSRRPAEWSTWEGAPRDLPDAVAGMKGALLLDCMTFWLTRLFLEDDIAEKGSEGAWQAKETEIRALVEALCKSPAPDAKLIIISNEVGFGLVPPYLMGRRFRDLQGRVNQLCAAKADRVALVVAGCPLWVKGTGEE